MKSPCKGFRKMSYIQDGATVSGTSGLLLKRKDVFRNMDMSTKGTGEIEERGNKRTNVSMGCDSSVLL